MAKIIHTMIRVIDEARSVQFYHDAFELTIASRLEFTGFTLLYLSNPESDFEIELTVNHDQTTPYTNGSGYGHIAFCVDNLDQTHQRFTDAGYQPTLIKDFVDQGDLIARFFFLEDPDGYKIEVLQRHGRYK